MYADLPFNETRTNYAERVVSTARRLVLPLIKKNRMLSARLAWSRLAVHGLQLLNWAFQEVKPELLPLYVGLAWDLTPLLSSSCSSHTLQGRQEPADVWHGMVCGERCVMSGAIVLWLGWLGWFSMHLAVELWFAFCLYAGNEMNVHMLCHAVL